MSFEGVVCPEDGAREGITQVEADTFYCSHHKGLFKYVDSSRLRVQVEGSFCPCDNHVEFRCQRCKRGLCPECDVVEWQIGPWVQSGTIFAGPSRRSRKLVVAIGDSGYLGPAASSAGFVPAYSRISTSKVSGPTLSADEILCQLGQGHPGAIRHLCGECLKAGVPVTIGAIVNGQMCEFPGCTERTKAKCKCCGAAFCRQHTGHPGANGRNPFGAGGRDWEQGVASVTCRTGYQNSRSQYDPGVALRGPSPEGLCEMCAPERLEEARQAIIPICDSWPGIARENGDSTGSGFYVINTPLLVKLLDIWLYTLEIKRKRAQRICGKIEKVVDEKSRELAQRSTPCTRSQWANKAGGYRLIAPRDSITRARA